MSLALPVPVAAAAGAGSVALLRRTWRYRRPDVGEASPDVRLSNAVYALWHHALLPLAVLHARQGAAVLTSLHRDGEIIARILHRWGYLAVRGSSSRGGSEGLREMIRAGRSGRPLAFTPDGPRGPARRCKPGVVLAAAETGLPVVPVGAAASPAWRVDSWDGFLVPLPGATIYVSHGPPIRVPRLARTELERWTRRIGAALDRETRRCTVRAGGRRGPVR